MNKTLGWLVAAAIILAVVTSSMATALIMRNKISACQDAIFHAEVLIGVSEAVIGAGNISKETMGDAAEAGIPLAEKHQPKFETTKRACGKK